MRNVISAVALVAGFMVAAPVVAVEQHGGIEKTQTAQHFLSKRPYAQPVLAKADSEQAWVGASLVVDGNNARGSVHDMQKLHMMGKRAF
ncbi:hypothetical protein [Methylophilus aquaticus]|uniref:Uncharacterized protein n=1 Tax=Methylophilus aquaticus TaxID=1971610 RepID=A0ABT9JUI8_9PROT|nr:hypothetical protein [Methylophilus aquaticus]MDP8568247.1 hypothetical protein [Methylophilus aquaticus]